jgi:DNA-binding CsgD family transcriptional regulator
MVILHTMKRPIYVRPLTDAERESLEAGLRSPDAFTLRRCQILLASDRGENAYEIARSLGCNPQTARNAIHAFNQKGLPEALQQGSKHPHTAFIGLSILNRLRACESYYTRNLESSAKERVCGRWTSPPKSVSRKA